MIKICRLQVRPVSSRWELGLPARVKPWRDGRASRVQTQAKSLRLVAGPLPALWPASIT
jgi:hypothetical protein